MPATETRTDQLQNSLAGNEQFIEELEMKISAGNGNTESHQKCIEYAQASIDEISIELARRQESGCSHV